MARVSFVVKIFLHHKIDIVINTSARKVRVREYTKACNVYNFLS